MASYATNACQVSHAEIALGWRNPLAGQGYVDAVGHAARAEREALGNAFTSPLTSLEINRHRAPLNELINVNEGQIEVDWPRVTAMLAHDADSKGKSYSPSIEAREARKLATAAMQQDWRDAHAELARQYPAKGKRWYSVKIARMPIACGRDAETIRKQLN